MTVALPPIGWGRFLAGFWIDPRRHPDFGWRFTRFLVNLGNSIALLYLLYFLADSVHVADPKVAVTIATGVNLAAVLVSTMAAGIASDRLGRRRVFVCGGALLMAAAAVLMACWPTWPGVVVAAVLLGLGFGTYSRWIPRCSPRCCRPPPTAPAISGATTSRARCRRWSRRSSQGRSSPVQAGIRCSTRWRPWWV